MSRTRNDDCRIEIEPPGSIKHINPCGSHQACLGTTVSLLFLVLFMVTTLAYVFNYLVLLDLVQKTSALSKEIAVMAKNVSSVHVYLEKREPLLDALLTLWRHY